MAVIRPTISSRRRAIFSYGDENMSGLFFIFEGEDEVAARGEFFEGSDRVVAIVVGTLVEARLTTAIKARVKLTERIGENMFRTSGPLGSFSAKIDLGYMIGLYGEPAWRELVTLKDVRNWFAHHLESASFKSQKINAWCRNLKMAERCVFDSEEELLKTVSIPFGVRATEDELKNPRYRFHLAASFFSQCLLYHQDTLQ